SGVHPDDRGGTAHRAWRAVPPPAAGSSAAAGFVCLVRASASTNTRDYVAAGQSAPSGLQSRLHWLRRGPRSSAAPSLRGEQIRGTCTLLELRLPGYCLRLLEYTQSLFWRRWYCFLRDLRCLEHHVKISRGALAPA